MALEQLSTPRGLFKFHSGRVIALGRVMLGITFLLAVVYGRSQTVPVGRQTYILLTLYAVDAIIIAAVTWRNWWLDARLAVVTHGIDMAAFTVVVFSSNGTTSPFFLFFVLPLLSAAVRWSWRETAITAAALILLFLIAALLIAGTGTFELERFVLRAGNLLILSLLLIWFGIHQPFTRPFFKVDEFGSDFGERPNPLARALGFAIQASDAAGGVLMIGAVGEDASDGFAIADGEARSFSVDRLLMRDTQELADAALLYDIPKRRALTRPPGGRFRFLDASEVIDLEAAQSLDLTQGLIAEVRTGTQHGWLVLWGISDLSTDYIDLGRELGSAVATILGRHALLSAIETGAAARARLSLARDVHDSIVQFLAGAAFRLEAIKRAARSGAAIHQDLDELKHLLVEEQGEIRGFVTALRRDRELELAEAVERASSARAAPLQSMVDRLSGHRERRARVDPDPASARSPAIAARSRCQCGAPWRRDRIDVELRVDDNQLAAQCRRQWFGLSDRPMELAVPNPGR